MTASVSHIIEAESVQLIQQGGTFLVMIPQWILRWNRDQPPRKIQHRWFTEPFARRDESCIRI
jgi:hypothetical protein